MDVYYSPTPAQAAAQQLLKTLQSMADAEVLLLLSGGSWFSVLAMFTDYSVMNTRMTVGCLDERFTTDPALNNYRQLQTTSFYSQATEAGVQWLDSSVWVGETHQQFSDRFAAQIDAWCTAHPNGRVVVALGMGEDGHTAGIFPHSRALTSTMTALGYEVAAEAVICPQRTTVTAAFLAQHVTRAIAYVAGPTKCSCLAAVLDGNHDGAELPARLWHQLPLALVTDCAEAVDRT